jgi:dTDP-4-dehydrorhamnose reductase
MLELWGGVECTVARVGDRYMDQLRTTGHHDRLSDLDDFAALGITAMRYPVLWERIAPERPDRCDWSWTDERLNRLRDLGIRPILGLVHHGSGPRYTGLADPGFARGLAEFAARVAERYPWAEAYTPINEPLTTARFSGLYGHWYPHGRDPVLFLRLLLNQLEGTRQAMRAIRKIAPAAQLIQTDDLGYVRATPPLRYQADFENERRWLAWDLLGGRVDAEHPLRGYLLAHQVAEEELESWREAPCPPDIVGINHYLSSERFLDHRLETYEPGLHGGNGRDRYADVEAVRVLSEGCAGPQALLREAWERYRLPLAVTEVHNGCSREEQMRWFAEVWEGAAQLEREGVDIRAVTAWSLAGATDWNSLLTRNAGHYESGVFDARSRPPRPTAMAGLLRDLARSERSDHPVLDTPGWWHRTDRLCYPPVGRPLVRPLVRQAAARGLTGKRRLLLIVGARGTLGQALARACIARALPHRCLGRDVLDIADSRSVSRVLAELRPWAVVNAAGCVDVDLAERDATRCWRDNRDGPELLAKTCAEHGIPMVTFSSDLVFDGDKPRPYLEDDPVAPLNVYGRSKAAAERAVLACHPRALVIRTSAFFGPWDRWNFAVRTLAGLQAGVNVAAVDGVLVSPTYVPDLVYHALDLLIDGESGIWHLANRGCTTWYDFAGEIAAAWGMDRALVRAVSPAEAGWVAPRPVNSALSSARGDLMPAFDCAVGRFIDAVRKAGGAPQAPLGFT